MPEKENLSPQGPTQSPVIPTFFRFVIPSVLSLLAISTASIVDGFFVGNFLGVEALAAVNVLMPYISLLFAVAIMLAVGGSVRAANLIGRKKFEDASGIFSKTILFILTLSLAVIPLVLTYSEFLFAALGADEALFPLMKDYFTILCFAMVIQLSCLVLYYFVRADNYPGLGMQGLLAGAATNILLDGLFVAVFDWGIKGAALATLFAQLVQLLVILRYFRKKDRHLKLMWSGGWSVLLKTSYNGFSEFINEISIGLVILVLHWIINQQHGAQGIAAFSVINYLIFISLMVYYGIVDAMHGLLSQNFGAGSVNRVVSFMKLAAVCIGVLSLCLVTFLHIFEAEIVEFFLEENALDTKSVTQDLIHIIWPLFLFNGFNVLVSSYLTSAEKAAHSSMLSICRSLILPLSFALGIQYFFSGYIFLLALPLAEGVTFVLALIFILQNRPSRLVYERSGVPA